MTKADKREQKIRQNTKNVSLEDFEWLIRKYGTLTYGGRHALAHIGARRLPYKRRNPVVFKYVTALLRIIDDIDKR